MRARTCRRWGVAPAAILCALLLAACGDVGSAEPPAAGDATILAAGDVADCIGDGEQATATIVARDPDATVAALGDLAYTHGTAEQFRNCYEPAWGRHKRRTKPTPGNHEYDTGNADAYFGYFGAAAGLAGKGWYSYELGSWHVVVLNSNCEFVDCSPSSEQVRWLRADLAAHRTACTLAYWHHPLFASGFHADDADGLPTRAFWDALHEHGADVILNGHDHDYERFTPLSPAGERDLAYGIRQFVVGTGGATLRGLKDVRRPGSENFWSGSHGVLELVLRDGSYAWEFLAAPGTTFADAGTNDCHGAPDPAP